MIIAEKKKAIFVHIEKTGGTSITKLLAPYVIDSHRFKKAKAVGEKGWRETNHINPQHSRFNESLPILDKLGINPKDYYKFAIVRNPYTWILSIWKNRYSKPMNVANTMVNRLRFNLAKHQLAKPFPSQEFHQLYPDGSFKSFLMFLDGLVKERSSRDLRRYLGAQDQYSYIENNRGIEFDFIGKLEKMNKAIGKINEKLDLAKGIEIPHLNKKSDDKDRKDFLEYYDQESLNLVNQLYVRDFVYFNYDQLTLVQQADRIIEEMKQQKPSKTEEAVNQVSVNNE